MSFQADGQRLPNSVRAQEGRLQFTSISESDAGTYICRARNNAGDSEARAEVIVNGKNIHSKNTHSHKINLQLTIKILKLFSFDSEQSYKPNSLKPIFRKSSYYYTTKFIFK